VIALPQASTAPREASVPDEAVPVEADPDSRVNIMATVLADMRGIARVRSVQATVPVEATLALEDAVLLDTVTLGAVPLDTVPLENTRETVS
jgi:hypothetical protein